MSSETVIVAKGLTKTYEVYNSPLDRFKQLLFGPRRRYFDSYTALRNIDIEVKQGEVVGFVGRNGAGKSTLLQLLCGTLNPSGGQLEVRGKVSALLELGAGFNPEFTGRENIFLAASLVGLGRDEVVALEDEIIDFAGIRAFIDQPVKTYSSGMFVRLAFSVATSVNPDILVIDEALSVGDGEFSKKSFDRIMKMRDAGKTILFCSHSLYQVEQLCDRVFWIDRGRVAAEGSPETVIKEYQGYLDSLDMSSIEELQLAVQEENPQPTVSEAKIRRINVYKVGSLDSRDLVFTTGQDDLVIDVSVTVKEQGPPPGVAIVINNENGFLVTSCGSWEDGFTLERAGPNDYRGVVTFPKLSLLKGRYKVSVMLFCDRGLYVYDDINEAAYLTVVQKGSAFGVVSLQRSWHGGAGMPEISSPIESAPTIQENQTEPLTIRFYTSVDETQVLSLFKVCFGESMGRDLWRWKYQQQAELSTVAFQGNRAVGFFGVRSTVTNVFGSSTRVAQICDVMVHPSYSAGLARASLFRKLKECFTKTYVGENLRYPYAFGFPTQRAYALGERLRVYTKVGEIFRLSWKPKPVKRRKLGFRAFDRADASSLSKIWQTAQLDFADLAINERTAGWVFNRFLDRPNCHYDCTLYYGRLTGRIIGYTVVRKESEGRVELMDILAPRAHMPEVLQHLLHQLHYEGSSELFAMVTPAVEEFLRGSGYDKALTETYIAGDEEKANSAPYKLQGRWWLIGGDTDSR